MQRRASLMLPESIDIKSGPQDMAEVSVTSDLLDFSNVKMLELEEIEEKMDEMLLSEIEEKIKSNKPFTKEPDHVVQADEIKSISQEIVESILEKAMDDASNQ